MRVSRQLVRMLASATIFLMISTGTLSAQECRDQDLASAKVDFQRLKDLRMRTPETVSDEKLRQASARYIAEAEACYIAQYGMHPESGEMIDEGGMWARGVKGRHDLWGTKWGAGTSFLPVGSNPNATGPRSPGTGSGPAGEVTYSFMPGGVAIGDDCTGGCICGAGCVNTSIFSFVFTDSGGDTEVARCLTSEIGIAFAAWSAVADIKFVPASDSGTAFNAAGALADIRIGFHPIDGASGTLAHGFFPPPNGLSAAGDVHFDLAEPWSCFPAVGSIDFGIVAIHEIGHAIGLQHETGGDLAIMNPIYNPALNFGPLADDIIGVGEIYGEAGAAKTAFFGDVGIGTDSPVASLNVKRDDGSARVRVDETSTTTATRTLFMIRNNGSSRFQLFDTNTGEQWDFIAQGAQDRFLITNKNSGVIDFLVNAGGNVTIAGSLTTAGSFVPDFVFDEDYPLLSLEELDRFVKKNRHLPNVPSAAEIEGSGEVNMTKMQMTLLEKIEELTLYTLRQHSEIRSLGEARISDHARLAELLKRLEALEGKVVQETER